MTQQDDKTQAYTADARMNLGLPSHPKTRKLQRRLGPAGPWALVCLILWAGHHRPDGRFEGMDDEDIEIAAGWEGDPGAFVAAASAVGFLDYEGDHYRLHDWEDHQPWIAGREERSRRSRKAAIAKHHGKEAAERMFPEGGEHAAGMRKACNEDADGMPPAGGEHAESCGPHADGTDPQCGEHAPFPSPSPTPPSLSRREQSPVVDREENAREEVTPW